ncbi:homeobox-containing protein 1-like [Patiria miniata]|uniref:Homeobox domain-containing protein n=1 Tax=Patiria miniata TaxID=46514 RepID=A0A914A0G4_PATMI|nr:homeobox-containing protein 1-like [Patiria miniata]
MMSTPVKNMSTEPRYTIEQISLLHRLLRTGLTKQDIIHALDSMTKMDAELQASSLPLTGAATGVGCNYAASARPSVQIVPTASPANMGMQRGTGGTQGRDGGGTQGTLGHEGGVNGTQGGAGILQGMSQEVMCGVENFQNVSDEEVDILFRRGPMAVKSEIRAFLNKWRLSQNQISMATGISQSYISSFLIHGFMMKHSTQELLYRWYLSKKREMEDLGGQPDIEHLENGTHSAASIDMSQSFTSPNNDNFLPTFKRRERFTWKDAHIRIMESYYSKNPYPNDFEREKIMEACNSESQQSGEAIPDSKWVTSSKVYNWFANRRKDSNRRKRLSQRLDNEGSADVQNAGTDQLAQSDHTHYASSSPQNVHVIEVHQNDGEDHETDDLAGREVHVVQLQMGGEQPQNHGRQVQQTEDRKLQSASDTKNFGGVNTIYTLIEAVEESDMMKNSQ